MQQDTLVSTVTGVRRSEDELLKLWRLKQWGREGDESRRSLAKTKKEPVAL